MLHEEIVRWEGEDDPAGPLADLVLDAVAGGASIGFVPPLTRDVALAYWREVLASAARGERLLFLARDGTAVRGTVQLVPERKLNGVHRAEIQKLVVHTDARGRGLGSRLLAVAEEAALAAGHWLLLLDTAEGQPAERLYRRLGWEEIGVIPDFALRPDGHFGPAVLFRKRLPVPA